MEYSTFLSDTYEVEKIINCKYIRNKKYYLIKWLCYPINQSTWEPKSNLENLEYMIEDFESKYPYSIDTFMYNIFCNDVETKKKIKNRNKNTNKKFLSKKRNKDFYSSIEELDKLNLDRLKTHLYIRNNKKQINDNKQKNDDLIIDLRTERKENEEKLNNSSENEINAKNSEEQKSNLSKLIMPNLL
jgi:hypothetical protein